MAGVRLSEWLFLPGGLGLPPRRGASHQPPFSAPAQRTTLSLRPLSLETSPGVRRGGGFLREKGVVGGGEGGRVGRSGVRLSEWVVFARGARAAPAKGGPPINHRSALPHNGPTLSLSDLSPSPVRRSVSDGGKRGVGDGEASGEGKEERAANNLVAGKRRGRRE